MRLGADYRRIWFGNASANLADGITFIALPLLAATATNSPTAVAALVVAYSLSRIVSVLGIGVLIDRGDRRLLLYLANFFRAGMFAVLTGLVLIDAASIAVLYVVYALMGVVETLSDGASTAVLPQAVPREGLDKANSQIAGTQLVIDEFVGPPLGGLLFAMAAFAPSTLNTVAFVLAGVAFWRLRGTYTLTPSTTDTTRRSIRADIRDGAQWAMRHRVVRLLIVVGGFASVGYMIPFSYLVLYARDDLDLGPTGYGLLLSFSALGGLLGSVVATRLRQRIGYGWSIIAALLVGATSFIVISLTSNVIVVAIALATYIAHAVVWNIMATSVRQRATPAAMMGRVGAVGKLVSLIGLAAGAGAGGLLASGLGYQIPFAIAGGMFVGAASLRGIREWENNEAPSARVEAVGSR